MTQIKKRKTSFNKVLSVFGKTNKAGVAEPTKGAMSPYTQDPDSRDQENNERYLEVLDAIADWLWESDENHQYRFIKKISKDATKLRVKKWLIDVKIGDISRNYYQDDYNRLQKALRERQPFKNIITRHETTRGRALLGFRERKTYFR